MELFTVTYLESSVVWPFVWPFEATDLKHAVRQAREYALTNEYPHWSVYRVESETGITEYGPFPYDAEYGEN